MPILEFVILLGFPHKIIQNRVQEWLFLENNAIIIGVF